MVRYTLDNFKEICRNGFNYQIEEETLEIISALANQVGAPEYIKTPNFNSSNIHGINERSNKHGNHSANGGRRKKKHHEMTDDDWDDLRSFHSKPKAELSPEKMIEKQYRGELNKLANGCNHEQLTRIIDYFNQYHEICGEEYCAEKIFFETAICSKINTTLFADVLCKMSDKDNNIEELMCIYISKLIKEQWLPSFEQIEYVNEDEEYDRFCDANRANELRLNTSRFLGSFFQNVFENKMTIYYFYDLINCAALCIANEFEKQLLKNDNEDVAYICCNNIIAFLLPLVEEFDTDEEDKFEDVEYARRKLFEIVNNIPHKPYLSLTRKIIFAIQDNKALL